MIVEWSETCRQNPSRTLPRKCTATAEPMKAQSNRNCGAKSRITTMDAPAKRGYAPHVLAGLPRRAQDGESRLLRTKSELPHQEPLIVRGSCRHRSGGD